MRTTASWLSCGSGCRDGGEELLHEQSDWTPEKGRRCLEDEDLVAAGLGVDERGRWHDPAKAAAVAAYFRKRKEMAL